MRAREYILVVCACDTCLSLMECIDISLMRFGFSFSYLVGTETCLQHATCVQNDLHDYIATSIHISRVAEKSLQQVCASHIISSYLHTVYLPEFGDPLKLKQTRHCSSCDKVGLPCALCLRRET